jgi:hypothetical protein
MILMRTLLALLVCALSGGAEPATLPTFPVSGALITAHPDSAAWPPLLSDDLANAEFPAGVWSMRDGILTATKDINLWTRRDYADCILDLEFRLEEGTNSGVFLYNSDHVNWMPTTVEIQILHDQGKEWRGIPANWLCGGFFGHLAPVASLAKEPGAWNRMTVACHGSRITALINGGLACAFDLSAWTDGMRNPDGSEIPKWLQGKPWASLPYHGRIGLQGRHADAGISFRNLRILAPPSATP